MLASGVSWEGVAATLDAIPVKRIGHGVRAIENADLVRRIADEGIHLEVCPVSNVTLGVYESYADHPLPALRAAGVRHSLTHRRSAVLLDVGRP